MKILRLLLTVAFFALMLPVLSGQNLAKDQMVLTWNFSPKEGVEITTLEDFVQKEYLPAAKKNFKGMEFYFLKSDRGSSEGTYSILVVLESINMRNEWWPEKGVSSEKTKAAMEKMKKVEETFFSLAKIDSWNDWVIHQ